MSGSMRIQGPFTFSPPTTNILSAHQQASVCIPLRINRAGSSAGILTEQFSTTIFINDLGNGQLSLNIQPTDYPTHPTFTLNFGYTIGQVMFLIMSWDSGTGPNTRGAAWQAWYLGDQLLKSQAVGIGCGIAGNRTLSLGSTGAGANYDMNIGPIAIWHDYALATSADISNCTALQDGANPSTIGPGPAVFWSFSGTPSAHPASGDPGLNSSGSLTGAGYNLSNLTPGTGGSASYSAETLTYAPPAVVDVYVSEGEKDSGGNWFSRQIYALTRTAPNTYPVGTGTAVAKSYISAVTGVSANPTFTLNGNPLTVYGGPIAVAPGNPGSGYVSPVFTPVADGKGVSILPIAVGGLVTNYKIISQGVDNTAITGSISDSGGTGSGATVGAITYGPYWNSGFKKSGQDFGEAWAAWNVNCGHVTGVHGYSGGSGYVSPAATAPGVVFGTPITADGAITAISVGSNQGIYGDPPTVIIHDSSGSGTGAKAIAIVMGNVPDTGPMTGIEMLSYGSGYNPATTTVTFSSGSATVGAITIQDNVIVDIPIISSGNGLGRPPVISIVDNGGAGSGADFICLMSGISPTDVVQMTAPERWISITNGGVGSVSNAVVTNYVGRPETVISDSYVGPDGVTRAYHAPAGGTPTMPVGVNLAGNTTNFFGVCTPIADWIHRVDGTVDSGTIAGQTFRQDGFPVSLGTTGTVTQLLVLNSVANGVDNRGQPLRVGTYNLVFIEGSPGTPTSLDLVFPVGEQGYHMSAPVVTTVGNVTTKAYDIEYNADPPSTFNMYLYLKYTNNATRANTLTRVALYCPGAAVDLADPLAPAPYFMDWLHAAAPKYPAILRIGDAAVVGTNYMAPSDLNLPTDYSWAVRHNPADQVGGYVPTWTRTLTIASVRPFMSTGGNNPVVVPAKVYLQEIYGFDDTPDRGPGTPGNRSAYASDDPSLAPYMISPPSPAFLFRAQGGDFAFEATTTAPHFLRTGDMVTIDNLNHYIVTVTSGVPGTTKTVGMQDIRKVKVYVTGAMTFAGMAFGSVDPRPPAQVAGLVTPTNTSGLPGNVNNVYQAATFSPQATAAFSNPGGFTIVPVEFYARVVNDTPGCGYHMNTAAFMTDPCIATLSQRLRDSLSPGRTVILEMSDEPWNSPGGDPDCIQALSIAVTATVNPTPTLAGDVYKMYAKRAIEQYGIFKSTFNQTDVDGISGRGGDVKLSLNSFILNAGITTDYVNFCKSLSVTPDYIMIAPYIDAPDTWVWPCAATAATHRSSVAYGLRTPWTLGMYLDWYRHHLILSIAHNAPWGAATACFYAQHLNAIGGPGTNFATPPKLITYEAGLQAIVPSGVSTSSNTANSFSDAYLGGKITHDAQWHPKFYGCHEAFHRSMQNGGIVMSIRQSFDGQRGTTSFHGSALWPFTNNPMNGIGLGDGSNGGKVNRFALTVNSQGKGGDGLCQDYYNDAPAMLAFRDWIAGTTAPSVNATAIPTSGVAPLTVQFGATATEPGGTIVGYAWDFGDGIGTSTQQNPTYRYTIPDTYTASVTVTDSLGATATGTVVVTVTAPVVSNTFFVDPSKVTIVW